MNVRGLCLAVLVTVGCAKSGSSPNPGPGPGSGITGVTVDAPSSVTGGLKVTLKATVQGTPSGGGVVWSVSGGGSVADVHANPVVFTAPMVTSATSVVVTATSATDGTRSGTATIAVTPAVPLNPRVQPAVVPAQAALPGPQGPVQVDGSRDAQGIQSDFVVGQLILHPRSSSDLSDFLQKFEGTVVSDDSIPEPPPEVGITLTAAQRQATRYLVRINLARVDLSTFGADAAAVGLGGDLDVSTEDGLRTLAAAASAASTGFTTSPNYVDHPTAFPHKMLFTQERPSGPGTFTDPFTASPNWSRFWSGGSQSNVTLAWQFVSAHGITRRVWLAIIDGGFWLNPDGTPRGTDTDLPANPVQYDFVDDDRPADGPNPANCSGGSSCFWHGNGSAGTALGLIDNRSGAAGTGGLVADPFLFKTNLSHDQKVRAIRTAVAWGADVVSMSFGGDCNLGCRRLDRDDTPVDDAINAGARTVFVASAGNGDSSGNGYDVGDPHFVHPCIEDHIICVGALADDVTTIMGYSNFGGAVDVFAPTDIPVMSAPAGNDNDPAGAAAPRLHTGTSASAPFVAGIAAMMKAINPALDNDTVATILHDTAHVGASPVDRYVDAAAAVRKAAEGIPGTSDAFEPNGNEGSPTVLVPGTYADLSLGTDSDHDYFRLDLATYSRVQIQVSSVDALGRVYLGEGYGLSADQLGCGKFVEESSSPGTNTQALSYLVPAGHYGLEVSGKINAYDLSWSSTAVALDAAAPDRFEPNDSLPSATDTGQGLGGHATLTPGDVDWYRIVSFGSLDSPYLTSRTVFKVGVTDVPVTVTLHDQNGVQVGAVDGAMDCQGGAGFSELAAGTWYVAVRARAPGGQGRYDFYAGVAAQGGIGPIHDRVYERVHPGDPVEGTLRSRFDRYIFTMGPEVQRLGTISQSPVLIQIQDLQGNLVGSGQPAQLQRVGYVTLVDLLALAVGTDYLVEISRPDAQADRDPGPLSGVAYTLGWASASPVDSGNIVANGNAEDGNQGAGTGQVVPLRFWTAPPGSNLTVVAYGSPEFPGFNDMLPADPGRAFFAGGPDVVSSTAEQVIDLTGQWAGWLGAIDGGRLTFRLSADLGGFSGENDSASLELTFLDESAQPLGAPVTLGGVSDAERGGITGFLPRATDGLVPPGTRQVLLRLKTVRTDGVYDDGYADDIELHLLNFTQQ